MPSHFKPAFSAIKTILNSLFTFETHENIKIEKDHICAPKILPLRVCGLSSVGRWAVCAGARPHKGLLVSVPPLLSGRMKIFRWERDLATPTIQTPYLQNISVFVLSLSF